MPDEKVDALRTAIISRRVEKGLLAKVMKITMPPDPKPAFVWPHFAVVIGRENFRIRNLAVISAFLLLATFGMIYLLLQVPYLDLSVIKILTLGFGMFIPSGWATAVAWIVGIAFMMSIGSLANHNSLQMELQEISATKVRVYDLILMLALWEELAFRSGSEKWSWRQRFRANLVFGAIHITNIWYSLAAGLAISLTGFGFLLVYLWYYRKTENEAVATSASATVHALYNVMAISLIIIVLSLALLIGV